MTIVAMLAATALQVAGAQAATPYPTDMQRAEICYAHVTILIEDAARETGRVAGPSWFISEWWDARLNDAQSTDDREATVKTAVEQRRVRDADGFEAERSGCMQEAIKAGAVPGM